MILYLLPFIALFIVLVLSYEMFGDKNKIIREENVGYTLLEDEQNTHYSINRELGIREF